jgi:hypothetical protein
LTFADATNLAVAFLVLVLIGVFLMIYFIVR